MVLITIAVVLNYIVIIFLLAREISLSKKVTENRIRLLNKELTESKENEVHTH